MDWLSRAVICGAVDHAIWIGSRNKPTGSRARAVTREEGSVVWTMNLDYPECGITTSDEHTWRLFAQGVEGLARLLPFWDYRGKWSGYGGHERLCPPKYHCLNRVLLETLGRISGISVFGEYADRWNSDRLSRLDRAEIHLGFLVTQTFARLRRRTWTHKTISGVPSTADATL